MRRLRLIVCARGCIFLLGTAVGLAGNPPKKSAGKKPEPAKKVKGDSPPLVCRAGIEAIEAALNKPIHCEFVETPLKDVVDYFQDVVQIQICLDSPAAFKEAGVDESVPITCNLKDLRFEKVLNRILDAQQLTWTIHDDVLLITSKANAEAYMDTRVYDVADLVVYQDRDGKRFDDYAPLTSLITESIAQKNWVENGGCGSIRGESLGTAKVLVVSNCYNVQEQIVALLADIRTVAAKKSGGDGPPFRERPKVEPKTTIGCFHCPGMIPENGSMEGGVLPAKPGEKPAEKSVTSRPRSRPKSHRTR